MSELYPAEFTIIAKINRKGDRKSGNPLLHDTALVSVNCNKWGSQAYVASAFLFEVALFIAFSTAGGGTKSAADDLDRS